MRDRDIPLEEFEYTLNVNLRASFVLVKGVIEGMKAQKWGRIIFMSSSMFNVPLCLTYSPRGLVLDTNPYIDGSH
jgi:NAD(P)-dependent dehydrogenase (short-subunit alcohol dehydrogenase family)